MPRKLSYHNRILHDEEKARERYRTILKVIFAMLVVINIMVRSGGPPSPETKSNASNTKTKENVPASTKSPPVTPAKIVTVAPRPPPPPPPPPPQQTIPAAPSEPAICHVALENKMDDNYDAIESIVTRFPLPWEKLGCHIPAGEKKPLVVFDVALAEDHRVGSNEIAQFKSYYESKLKNTVVERTDGLVRAQFGDFVSYKQYSKPYKAAIGVTCDQHGYNFLHWMNSNIGAYCVLRNPCPECSAEVLARSCWTTAAANNNAPGACSFLADSAPLPKPF